MFTSEQASVNGKALRRKLLSGAKDFAEKIIEDSKTKNSLYRRMYKAPGYAQGKTGGHKLSM